MYQEIDFIPISALQHWIFCHRRAALIFIERLWQDNLATTEGHIMHERAHGNIFESRGDVRFRTALMLHSLSLGITGVADVVEFHRVKRCGVTLDGASGLWKPFPVEYKRGTMHHEEAYEVQLCAQALCLEEMLGTTIELGAIYWGESRRRQEIEFRQELREYTLKVVEELRGFLDAGITPAPRYEKKCRGCSLFDLCMPKEFEKKACTSQYWKDFFANLEDEASL